jgi:FkbM family methyltransferase
MEQDGRQTLEMADGSRVVVPRSLRSITAYVLTEQRDWFEEEIRFVRRALEPGQRAVDIGANFGVFTLSMARAVGPAGHVWAFEPASRTADFLAQSIEVNGLANVSLRRMGISARAGSAALSLNEDPELNEIVRPGAAAAASERIELCSLDELDQRESWHPVDFLKIDAEGEESRIIEGASAWLRRHSPLIQFEIKASSGSSLDAARRFADRGYMPYRLVPGLGALVPFNFRDAVDPLQLNLFCCRPDRAARLAARGLLVEPHDVPPSPGPDVLSPRNTDGSYDWSSSLVSFEYARGLLEVWRGGARTNERSQVERALALFSLARDPGVPVKERFLALRRSIELLEKASRVPEFMRLGSLARVARAFGARAKAVASLDQLVRAAGTRGSFDPSEPFLAPCERFEGVSPSAGIQDWLLAAALEEFELASTYSSYYSASTSAIRLSKIASLGLGSEEMSRRLELVRGRLAAGG